MCLSKVFKQWNPGRQHLGPPFALAAQNTKKNYHLPEISTKKNGAVNSVDHSIDTQLRFITARFRTTAEMFNPVRSRTCHARFSCAELVAMITNILTAVVFIPGCVCKLRENAKIDWLITIFLALEVFPSAKVPFFRHTPPYCWWYIPIAFHYVRLYSKWIPLNPNESQWIPIKSQLISMKPQSICTKISMKSHEVPNLHTTWTNFTRRCDSSLHLSRCISRSSPKNIWGLAKAYCKKKNSGAIPNSLKASAFLP